MGGFPVQWPSFWANLGPKIRVFSPFTFNFGAEMISANNLRGGNLVEFDGILYRVATFQHVKPGKGGGFVRLKLKNVELGTVTDKTLDSEERCPTPATEEKEMQYLYKQNDKFVFMDTETYEQLELTEEE